MAINSLSDGIKLSANTITANPIAAAVGAAGVGAVLGLGTAAIIGAVKQRKNKRRKTRNSGKRNSRIKHTKRGLKQDRARRSKQKWEVAYQRRKRKMKSKKGIHYTKNGQPYKIMSNGRARFIKRKGGKR